MQLYIPESEAETGMKVLVFAKVSWPAETKLAVPPGPSLIMLTSVSPGTSVLQDTE